MSALQYYVYYKADPARVAELRTVVEALFREMHESTGVQGQWQRRRDDPATFMETYLEVTDADAFDRALALAVKKTGFDRLGVSRVTEIFQCA